MAMRIDRVMCVASAGLIGVSEPEIVFLGHRPQGNGFAVWPMAGRIIYGR